MTIEEAADRLLQTYSTYGVRREFLIELMEDGVKITASALRRCFMAPG